MRFRETNVGGFFIVSGTNDELINNEIQRRLTMLNADMEDAQYSTSVHGEDHSIVMHHVLIMYKERSGRDGSVVTPVMGATCTKLDHALKTAQYLESYTGNCYYVKTLLSIGKEIETYEYLARLAHSSRSSVETVDIVNPEDPDKDRCFNLDYNTFVGMLKDTKADAFMYRVVNYQEMKK